MPPVHRVDRLSEFSAVALSDAAGVQPNIVESVLQCLGAGTDDLFIAPSFALSTFSVTNVGEENIF